MNTDNVKLSPRPLGLSTSKNTLLVLLLVLAALQALWCHLPHLQYWWANHRLFVWGAVIALSMNDFLLLFYVNLPVTAWTLVWLPLVRPLEFLWATASHVSQLITAVTNDFPKVRAHLVASLFLLVGRLLVDCPPALSRHEVFHFCQPCMCSSWGGIHGIWIPWGAE